MKKNLVSVGAEPPRHLKAFLFFLLQQIIAKRRFWLLPFWVLLVGLGIVLFLSGNGALLPAIYILL